jgi:hypothetical protein
MNGTLRREREMDAAPTFIMLSVECIQKKDADDGAPMY